ncbi:hypothetical protein [Pseudosulfitobacter pseudonitzschiae]|uniref:hypothetical protein n=1 Tax=Pseudosulfitobacter pseudonitzschiae TaxID=1402135 RepID=UPI001AF69716|nr:hypothetical protein [Pseudosulfitobacter pseudonitzschiae]MBM1816140.1 hypothetical protein [Pseudosulfitobacter pseudonitzschiae]MBM1833446.1 hypothetical protein [Pseudosulfitobacter pseudonitzschiae]MBM1838313.1 hypothetical protein [Pseudosulfitobacter pseudonitzschiae]MBM1842845.1 hypothetical protein [Pseudosulfitobacter pseudonitzschiae]MBM1847711.1 hypothetical protein [Pseudosulfitobacter pseudonitzschiae]
MPAKAYAAIACLVMLLPVCSFAQQLSTPLPEAYQVAQSYSCGRTCGQVGSCREAVYQWCVCGYARADGDHDGVPCEKLCGQSTPASLARVQDLKAEFGCR